MQPADRLKKSRDAAAVGSFQRSGNRRDEWRRVYMGGLAGVIVTRMTLAGSE
jgi:hypothetical protein